MTRRSKREIDSALDKLGSSGEFDIGDYLWVGAKRAHGADLTSDEQRLLDSPEDYLSESEIRYLKNMDAPRQSTEGST